MKIIRIINPRAALGETGNSPSIVCTAAENTSKTQPPRDRGERCPKAAHELKYATESNHDRIAG
jgi:hypothetical protein